MDVIKTEFKTDLLDLQSSDRTYIEDEDPLSQDGRFSDFDVSGIKTELADSSYDDTFRTNLEQDPSTFSFVKCEIAEESLDSVAVKEELHLDETTTESEVSIERFPVFQNDEKLNRETWNGCDESLQTNSFGEDCSISMENEVLNQSSDISMKLSTENTMCGKLKASKSNVSSRLQSHTDEKPFKCNECGKYFKHLRSLREHLRSHTGDESFKCNECGKCFVRANYLNLHLQSHTGLKPFKCEECGKCFGRPEILKQHMRSHTGEKPFKCNECGKSFKQSGYLIVHLRTHTGDKPFKCDECGVNFVSLSLLKQHLAVHSPVKPFKCDECGKFFSSIGRLKSHQRSHLGLKPFKCEECGKCFARSDNRNTHLRTHRRKTSRVRRLL